jgi:hypothetical protein
MLSFLDFKQLSEGLRILKKAADVNKERIDAAFDKYDIIISKHTEEERKGFKRNEGISNPEIIAKIKEAFSKGLIDKDGYIHIMFKNEAGKFDDILINKTGYKITVVTLIMQNRDTPNYLIKQHDDKVILEKILNIVNIYEVLLT